MKTAGIIGGIAPESTIQYYRKVGILGTRFTIQGTTYPSVFSNAHIHVIE